MKQNIILTSLITIIIFASCSKQSSIAPANITDNDTASSNLILTGTFSSVGSETVMGHSRIYNNDGKYTLVLNDFSTTAGPDLHVYLSQEAPPIHFIDLGKLRANSGTQVYDIPGMPDFNLYTFVLIHCQQYNHLFGESELK